MMYKCIACGLPCELVERDDGGMEDIAGAYIWHPMPCDYSECCMEEYEEVE